MASSGVHYEVDSRQGKAIFRASPVNINNVNAESSFSICLLDENHISQLVGIIYFPDSSGLEEFADLLVDRLLPFWGKTSSFLFDGFEGGGDIQLVGDNFWVNCWVLVSMQLHPSLVCVKVVYGILCPF